MDEEIIEIIEKFLNEQENLGDEFQKVWDENVDILYES